MKTLIALLFLSAGLAYGADTYTANVGLIKPEEGSGDWGPKIRANYDIIDSSFSVLNATETITGGRYFAGPSTITFPSGNNTVFAYHGTTPFMKFGQASSLFIGDDAGSTTSSQGGLTAVGYHSMQNVGACSACTAVGYNTLSNSAGVTNGTAIGNSALANATTGFNPTAVGYSALLNMTAADYNTAVGGQAMASTTSGSDNTAIGAAAMISNTTGYSNTAVGSYALYHNVTGYYNVAVGHLAGYSSGIQNNQTPIENTYIGRSAGEGTVGRKNIFLGYSATSSTPSLVNAVALGAGATVGCSTCVAIGDSALSWKVGIGTATPTHNLHVIGNARVDGYILSQSKTLAELAAIVPGSPGQSYYCSNCTTDALCVSTQAVTASWARVSAKGTACQ